MRSTALQTTLFLAMFQRIENSGRPIVCLFVCAPARCFWNRTRRQNTRFGTLSKQAKNIQQLFLNFSSCCRHSPFNTLPFKRATCRPVEVCFSKHWSSIFENRSRTSIRSRCIVLFIADIFVELWPRTREKAGLSHQLASSQDVI